MNITEDILYFEKIRALQRELQSILNQTKAPSRDSRHLSIANQELIALQLYIRKRNANKVQRRRHS